MEFSGFLEKNFSDIYVSDLKKSGQENFLQEFSRSRKEIVKRVFQHLDEDSCRLIYLKGSAGTGKTHLLKYIASLLESNILTYYYQCYPATNLDDIILALFGFLKKVTVKDTDYIRTFKVSASLSIDERLVNRLKKLEKPLLIFIDGIEDILSSEDKEKQAEFLNFLDFTLSVPAIKLILAGENNFAQEDGQKVKTIDIKGLEQKEAYNLIKNSEIIEPEDIMQDIFSLTQGFPENVLLFSTLVLNSEKSSREVIKKQRASSKNFEKFILEEILSLISEEHLELINFFAITRHSFSPETLYQLGFDHDIKENLLYLNSLMLLDENNGSFGLKQRFRDYINQKISLDERIGFHNQLHEIYSEQIATKLEERVLPLSRGLLYSEQYYHFQKLVKLEDREEEPAQNSENTSVEEILRDKEPFSEEIYEENQEFINTFSDDSLPGIELTDEEKAIILEKPVFEEPDKDEVFQADTEENLQEILAVSEQDKNELDYNLALFRLANLYKDKFKHDKALRNYYAVLNSKNIPGNIIAESYESVGEIYDYRRDYTASISYYSKALIEAEKDGNSKQIARIYFKMALSSDDAGNYDKAIEFYDKNIQVSQDIAVNPYLAAAYSNTAAIYEEKNSSELAVKMYKKSLNFDIQTNNTEGQYEVLSKLGNIYFETKNYPEAGRYFYRELAIAKKIDDPYKIAMSYLDIGDIFLPEKNYEKALKAFILAKKSIDKTISTDSKEKINRRFKQVIAEIGRKRYSEILDKLKGKNA